MVSKVPDDNIESASHLDNHDVVSESSPVESPTSFLWLTNRDQWLVVIVSVIVVILLAVKWQNLRYIDRSEIIVQRGSEDIGYQIDLNSATWVELSQLRGVGPVTAKLIVSNREEVGPFSSIDDLQRVKGIGPKTVEKNRRWLRVGFEESSADTASDR
jgi:competence ComEA-like helix-hairpin-helix protein